MSEETPFKPIKITLSEEAMRRLRELRTRGYFRSDSATIEEIIRTLYEIAYDVSDVIDRAMGKKLEKAPVGDQAEALRRIGIRLGRFAPLTEKMREKLRELKKARKRKSSAGT